MNKKQIKKLAEQAAELCQTEFESESLRQRQLYNEIFLPKFAELIVMECAVIALREDHEPSECILKHFGVEE